MIGKEKGYEKVDEKLLYFTLINETDRKKVKTWLRNQKRQDGKTKEEKEFLDKVEKAVNLIQYDYRISTIEPSVYGKQIYYCYGEKTATDISDDIWEKMAQEYYPEMCSGLANELELFLWYAVRIVKKLWSLEFVADDSSLGGNYCNSPNGTYEIERTGHVTSGGYADGQGNTIKIVKKGSGYTYIGGCCIFSGKKYPVAHVCSDPYCDVPEYASGVLALRKVKS